jgi:glycosyltransferase involved in cell wall biosynthesis
MRVAWFSPLAPDRSGIASYTADVLPLLEEAEQGSSIDRFVDRPAPGPTPSRPAAASAAPSAPNVFSAHDFVWKQQRAPYDLVVYQLGNAHWHDYMWAYLAAYPGLVVLHDTRLHHARARHLLDQRRHDDYRREFRYDHPGAPPGVEEYAVEGLGGSIYYFWSMLPVVLRTARLVAVHNARIADGLRQEHPGIRVETIRMGVPSCLPAASSAARARLRAGLRISDAATAFIALGHVTVEKRIEPILRTLQTLEAGGADVHLVLAGHAAGFPSLGALIDRLMLSGRVHVVGYVADDRVADYLAAADACLCLRWPTAGETSASWLRALAAARPTIVSGLAQLADVPTIDATTGRISHASGHPVAISVDLLDEENALLAAMTRLTRDPDERNALARAGQAFWSREHTLALMADDYKRVMREAASRPAPHVTDLPAHFTDDGSSLVRRLAQEMDIEAGDWQIW